MGKIDILTLNSHPIGIKYLKMSQCQWDLFVSDKN